MAVIAILIDTYGSFQQYYIMSLAERLKVRGFGVIAISGRELEPDMRSNLSIHNHANRIYSVVKEYNVAGYIFLSGCIGHNMERAELDGFVQEFTSRPTVSLGIDLPSVSSIRSDSRSGMRQLMEHLTDDGQRKSFVFIQGFKNDIDSIERESIFREVLGQRGIPVNEELILTGNYLPVDAYEVLDPIVRRHPEIDAIVSANDEMAAAAIQVLKKHNLKVPEDVVVSGFDNSSLAKETSPPLTSVQQSFDEHVIAAVDTLISKISKPETRNSIKPAQCFSEKLIIRESSRLRVASIKPEELAQERSPEKAWVHFYRDFVQNYNYIIEQSNGSSYESLFLSIGEQLTSNPEGFNQYFIDLFNEDEYRKRDWAWWLEVEHLLTTLALRVSQEGLFSSYVPLLLELQIQARSYHLSLKSSLAFDVKNSSLHHVRFESMLAKCQFMDDIRPVLDAYFSHHNISRAFLVLYNSKSGAVDCLAKVMYTYGINESEKAPSYHDDARCFESRDILPEILNKELTRATLVLDPLYVDEIQLGYSLIDYADINIEHHEYFSYALSDALNRCYDFRPSLNNTD